MALIPLNTFKTRTVILNTGTFATSNTTTNVGVVYTAPPGVTTIVLMAQASNLTTSTQYVTFEHRRNVTVFRDTVGNPQETQGTISPLVKDFAIPPNDAASLLSGKMIIENLDSVSAYASSEGSVQLVLSILETANQ